MQVSFRLKKKGKSLIMYQKELNHVKKVVGLRPNEEIVGYSIQKNRKSAAFVEKQDRKKDADGNYPVKSRYITFSPREVRRLGLKEGINKAVIRRSRRGEVSSRRRLLVSDRQRGMRSYKSAHTYTWEISLDEALDSVREILLQIRQDIDRFTRWRSSKDIFYVSLQFYATREEMGELSVYTPKYPFPATLIKAYRRDNAKIVAELRAWLIHILDEMYNKRDEYTDIYLISHTVTVGSRD